MLSSDGRIYIRIQFLKCHLFRVMRATIQIVKRQFFRGHRDAFKIEV